MDGDESQNQTPQINSSKPLPQAEAPSKPAQPVSEPSSAPATPAEPVGQTAQPETQTAHIPVNEPLPQNDEPSGAPAQAPRAHSGRDLLVKARQTIQQRKQKKLDKILDLFATKEKITNDEVEKLLHVSDATATRYLSELRKQGKIRQVGRTGKAVVYTK